MKIEQDIKLDFSDVLIRPKRSTLESRNDINLEREFKFPHSNQKWKGVPIIASNMDTVGTVNMYESLTKYKMLTCFHKFLDINEYPENNDNNYMISIGIRDEDYNKLEVLYNTEPEKCNIICIDIANGYIKKLVNFCLKVRKLIPNCILIAGSVVTREMVEELILNGKVDIVRVGIGSGSVCTTRLQTGVGMPQFSSVMECADAAHGLGAHIIADGGCTCPGDVAKGFGAGADFVMLGGMLAGHKEGGGTIINDKENKYIEFYGSSSEEANEKHYGGLANYRSSEGKKVRILMKSSLDGTVRDILGGVRSSCTYVGASSLKQLSKCTTFVRVKNQYNDTFGKV